MPGFLKDSSVTLLVRIIVIVVGTANGIITARVLGPALKGSFNLITLIVSVVLLFVLLGLGSANVYQGAGKPDRLPALAGNSIIAGMGLGFIGILVVESILVTPQLQIYLNENGVPVQWIRWLILLLPIFLLSDYLQEIIRAAGNIVLYNVITFLGVLINFCGTVIFVWLLNYGVLGAVTAFVVARVFIALVTLIVVLRIVGWRVNVDLSLLYSGLAYGFRLYPGNLAQFLNYRLDVFLIAFFMTPTAVGHYTAATGLAEKVWELPHALRTVLLQRVATLEGSTAAIALTTRITRLISISIGIVCVVLALSSYPLILVLYGTDYLPSVAALVALIPGIWALSVGKLLTIHMAGSGRPIIGTYAAIVSLVTTVVLDILLIPQIGLVGAALASSTSYVVSMALVSFYFLQDTEMRIADIFWPNHGDISLLHRILMNFIRQYMPGFVLQRHQ